MRGPQRLMPPDTITSRVDGWFGSADHVPHRVARMIVEAMPLPDDGAVAAVRARMAVRQRMHDRMRALANE